MSTVICFPNLSNKLLSWYNFLSGNQNNGKKCFHVTQMISMDKPLTNLSCLMERMILLPSPAAGHVCLHAAWSRIFHLWHTAFPVFQPKLNEIFSSFPGASLELFIASLTFSRSQTALLLSCLLLPSPLYLFSDCSLTQQWAV